MQSINTFNQTQYSKRDFIRSSRTHHCPMCGGTDGDCIITIDGKMAMCLHTHQPVPGWDYKGDAKGGAFWGIFIASESDNQRDGRWAELKSSLEQRHKEDIAAQAKGKLDPEEIDANTRKLVKYYGLSRAHEASLLLRGFKEEQLNTLGFFSVTPGEKLPPLFPVNYPGVKGGSLPLPGSAIFMPGYDLEGLIHGGQYRLDNGENGRYRWPCGYKSSHLKNGELPLTFVPGDKLFSSWSGEDFGREAYCCEGFPKAILAAYNFHKLFVGAANGNFSGSTEQFTNFVETKKIHTINITPDAGDVKNPQVMRRWLRQYNFFRELGLFVRVVWWGQIDKEHDDIDELPKGASLSFISWEQFSAHARSYGGITPGDNWFEEKTVPLADYLERVEAIQKELKDFTPWVVEMKHERYITLNLDKLPKGIYPIKSGTGTGKTTLAQLIIKYFPEGNILSYRNSVLYQLCNKSRDRVVHLHDVTTSDPKLNRSLRQSLNWAAACVDSCFKLTSRKVLILEEVDKLLQHMLAGSTCSNRRNQIILKFVELVRDAEYVFCFDADMTAISAKYLSEISGKPTFGIYNKGEMAPCHVSVYGGEKQVLSDGQIKVCKNARGGFERDLIIDILKGKKIIVVSDCQRQLVGAQRLIAYLNPKIPVKRIDGFTKSDPATSKAVQLFLDNPDLDIENTQPQVLLISPTGESSLDINIPYFDKVYGIFFGVINHRQIMQMLARYRQPVERVIFCKTFSNVDNNSSRSPLPAVIARNYFNHHQDAAALLEVHNHMGQVNGEWALKNWENLRNINSDLWQSPHFQAVCCYKAMDNYSKSNLREFLIQDLSDIGHNVSLMPLRDKTSYDHIKLKVNEYLAEEAAAIVDAEDIDCKKAMELWESMNLTPEDRYKCIKAQLKNRLPEFELTEGFVYDHYLKDPNYISRLELRWAMLNLDKAKLYDTSNWANYLNYGTSVWDMRSRSLQAQLLNDLGVPQLIEDLKQIECWDCDEKLITEFQAKCLEYRHKLRYVLNINADTKYPTLLVKNILDRIGFKLKRKRMRHGDGERSYFYSLDFATSLDIDDTAVAVLKAIDTRFSSVSELSPTSHRYKKIYNSTQLGTLVVPDIDPLVFPHLFNQLLGVEPPAGCLNEKDVVNLFKSEHSTIEFELGVCEALGMCDSWEMVAEFLGSYSLVERQVAWCLVSVGERERLARMRRKN